MTTVEGVASPVGATLKQVYQDSQPAHFEHHFLVVNHIVGDMYMVTVIYIYIYIYVYI